MKELKRCKSCTIREYAECDMCKHNDIMGCKKGHRRGGLHRKCFECRDYNFCKTSSFLLKGKK